MSRVSAFSDKTSGTRALFTKNYVIIVAIIVEKYSHCYHQLKILKVALTFYCECSQVCPKLGLFFMVINLKRKQDFFIRYSKRLKFNQPEQKLFLILEKSIRSRYNRWVGFVSLSKHFSVTFFALYLSRG